MTTYITVFDFETTGLLKAAGNSLAAQPHATELYAMQLDADDDYKVVCEFHSYFKPPIPIPDHITKITGINDYTVQNAPMFGEKYQEIADVFFGSHTAIGANITFDMGILINELKRIDKEYHFPYPPIWFCTIEQSMHIKGYRLKNGELYTIATGKILEGAHQAKNDVMATFANYKYLKGIK